MSNETALAVMPQCAIQRKIDPPVWNALKEIYDGASDEKVALVIDYCIARKMDPLKKPVHIVPTYSSRRNCMVETIWPAISETRMTAMRTGLYAGADETKFGPTIKEKLGTVDMEFPEWAQVNVYRLMEKGNFSSRVVFPGPRVYFVEAYATRRRDDPSPNAMWAKRTWGQLEKCAEAAALRKAFPEETGGISTAEEMHGKTVDDDGLVDVTKTAAPDAGGEPVKRAAVPRKNKGAAAMEVPVTTSGPAIETETTVVTASTFPEPEKAPPTPRPPDGHVPTPAAAPTPAPTEPKPKAEPKPEPKAEEKPASAAKTAEVPEWPKTIVGLIAEVKDAPVTNNPKYSKVKIARLCGGTCKLKGVEVPLEQLGRVVFDPEIPALQKFAVIGDDKMEFTIEERDASQPGRKNLVIVKAALVEEVQY